MKTTPRAVQRRCRARSDNGKHPKFEVVTPEDRKRFDHLLGQYHYLGETCPVGDFLRQVAILDGEWVGLLGVGRPADAVKDRDQYIGWTPTLRAGTAKTGWSKTGASCCCGRKRGRAELDVADSGASVKVLPEQWLAYFGYVPLLAETFTDLEAFAGTSYKAAGDPRWADERFFPALGGNSLCPTTGPRSSGLSRCGETRWRCWVPRHCRRPISRARVPARTGHALAPAADRVAAGPFEPVSIPRAANREFHIGAVLSIVAMALLSGQRDISQIMRFGWRLTQAQRKSLGLPRKDAKKFYRVPGYKVYYNLLSKLNPDTLGGEKPQRVVTPA